MLYAKCGTRATNISKSCMLWVTVCTYKHLFPAPLNFSIRKFDVGNGCGGKMPVLMHEWIQVGIWRLNTLRRHGSESLCTHEVSLQK